MSPVKVIEDAGPAAAVVGERDAEEAGRVALRGDSDGNIEIVTSWRVSCVIKQRIALLLLLSSPNLPLLVRGGVVGEHIRDRRSSVLQTVLEVPSLLAPGLVLVRAVTAVVRQVTDLQVMTLHLELTVLSLTLYLGMQSLVD